MINRARMTLYFCAGSLCNKTLGWIVWSGTVLPRRESSKQEIWMETFMTGDDLFIALQPTPCFSTLDNTESTSQINGWESRGGIIFCRSSLRRRGLGGGDPFCLSLKLGLEQYEIVEPGPRPFDTSHSCDTTTLYHHLITLSRFWFWTYEKSGFPFRVNVHLSLTGSGYLISML